jgi:hypothetical protein
VSTSGRSANPAFGHSVAGALACLCPESAPAGHCRPHTGEIPMNRWHASDRPVLPGRRADTRRGATGRLRRRRLDATQRLLTCTLPNW